MRSYDIYEQIVQHLTNFKTKIDLLSSSNHTSLNTEAERLYMNVLNIVHGWDLINANDHVHNFPAVDLADFKQRIAVQVTSDTKLSSIKQRIDTFNRHRLQDKFETFYFYLIGEKSSSISSNQLYPSAGEGLRVDLDIEVIGVKALLREIRASGKEEEVLAYLDLQFPSKAETSNQSRAVTNHLFSGANLSGATVNVVNEAHNVMLGGEPAYEVHEQVLGHSSAPLQIVSSVSDSSTALLDRTIKQINDGGIQSLSQFDVESIYDDLEQMQDPRFDEISNTLWLLIYFEKSAPLNPSLGLKKRASAKREQLQHVLSEQHIRLVKGLELKTQDARDIVNLIES